MTEVSKATDRLGLSIVVQVAGRLGSAVLGLVVLRLLTRQMGPQGFGSFSAALALTLLLNALTSAGIATSAARDASADQARAGAVHAAALCLRGFSGLVCIPVAVVVASLAYHGGPSSSDVALLGLGAGAAGVASVSSLGLVMGGSGWLSGLLDTGRQAILVVSVLALMVGAGTSPALAYAVGLLLGMAVTVGAALRSTPWRNPSAELRPLLRAAAPLGVVEALNTIYFRIDSVILAVVAGNVAVGDYSLAYRVVELGMTVPGIVMTTLAPRLARSGSPAEVVREGLELLQQMAVPLLLLGWVAAPLLVDLVSVGDFRGAVLPLRLLLVATVVSFLVAPYGNGLVLLGLQARLVRVAVVVTVTNVLANLVVVPALGAAGAAACVVTTELVALVMARRRFDDVARLRLPLLSPSTLGGLLMLAVWGVGARVARGNVATVAILLAMSAVYALTLVGAARRGRVVG